MQETDEFWEYIKKCVLIDRMTCRASIPTKENLDRITMAENCIKSIDQHVSSRMDNQEYVEAAKDLRVVDGEIEVYDLAAVSVGEDKGNYVAAWVWVSDDDLVGR